MSISEAAVFFKLDVPTLYSKVSKNEIPVNKPGKRLHFIKGDLVRCLKEVKNKTAVACRRISKIRQKG
jgi:excisionase family DNA binding protein